MACRNKNVHHQSVVMKKFFRIISLLLGTALYGQDPEVYPLQQAPVTFGVKGGVIFSLINPESRPGIAPIQCYALHGMYIGAFIHRPLSPRWAFRPELLLSAHGFGVRDDSGESFRQSNDDHYLLGYINLPLLLQYEGSAGVVWQGGLQPGVELGPYEELKTADMAWVVGAAYMSRAGLGVEVRYTAGLANLANRDYEYTYLAKVKNRVVQIGMVYVLRRRKQ